MQKFIKNINSAKELAATGNLEDALKLADETFRIYVYEESEEEIILGTEVITAVDIARKIAEKIVQLPEIEDNKYTRSVLDATNNAIADYLQDIIGPDEFWNAMVELTRLLYFLQGASAYLAGKGQQLGSTNNPAISIALEEDGNIQLYALLSEDGLSLEKAAELQKSFTAAKADKNMSAADMINLAGKLLTGKQFTEAIGIYEDIILRYPDETGQCLNAIGACHYYLENYETAIDFYLKALNAGELKSRVEYNVWESCQSKIDSLENRNDKMKWKFLFEDNFPESEYKLDLKA